MAKTKRPAFKIDDRITLASYTPLIPAHGGRPFVGRDTVLRVIAIVGKGTLRDPRFLKVADDNGHSWTIPPDDVVPAENRVHMSKGSFRVEQEIENASGPTGTWKVVGTFKTREEAVKDVRWRNGHGGNARLAHLTKRAHAGKKTDKDLDREIADAVGLRDGWVKVKVREDWPETWDKLIKGWWHTLERRPGGGWYHGADRRRGNADTITRGSWFPSWDAAAKFAEQY